MLPSGGPGGSYPETHPTSCCGRARGPGNHYLSLGFSVSSLGLLLLLPLLPGMMLNKPASLGTAAVPVLPNLSPHVLSSFLFSTCAGNKLSGEHGGGGGRVAEEGERRLVWLG